MPLLDPLLQFLQALFGQLTPIPLDNALSYVYTILYTIALFFSALGNLGG